MHQEDVNSHLIIWQKWADPFGGDDDILIPDSINYENHRNEEPEFHDTEDEKEESMEVSHQLQKPSRQIRVMATPMGIIPFTENTASSKIFNFWVGHSNFNITKKIASIIEEISGVEALDIFTRYRFRIAIGKAFKDSRVMQKINEKVYTYLD
jgi:hypothetical protein